MSYAHEKQPSPVALVKTPGNAETIFNLVVEASPSAMILVDNRGRIALVNTQTEKLFGYSREELLGNSIEMLIPEELRGSHQQSRQDFEDEPTTRNMGAGRDLFGRRKDGSNVPIEIGLNPIESGVGTFTLAGITDISERKAAEKLRHEQAEMQKRVAAEEAQRERKWLGLFQQAVLPTSFPLVAGCSFDAVYEPGLREAKVGGDWYDAVRLLDGRILISIGDVSGFGLEAAVIVGVMRQIIRGISQLRANPTLILDAADRALRLEYPNTYVSAWVGLIDLVERTLTFASAGHPLPLLVSADGQIQELHDNTTMLLGLRESGAGTECYATLKQGDTLVLYTDGVTESEHDAIQGHALLRNAASSIVTSLPKDPAKALYHEILPHGASDDVAILVVCTDYAEADLYIDRWKFDVQDNDATSLVRTCFLDCLTSRGFSLGACQNAEIILRELLGNVVQHAGGSPRIEVALDNAGPDSVLHVIDNGTAFDYIKTLPHDPSAENGRGLFLVTALTKEFTIFGRPHGGSHARAVLYSQELF